MNISSVRKPRNKPRNKSKKNKTKRLNRRIKGGPRKYMNKRTNCRMKKGLLLKNINEQNKLKQRGKHKGGGGGEKVPYIATNIVSGHDGAAEYMESVIRSSCHRKYRDDEFALNHAKKNKLYYTGFLIWFQVVPYSYIYRLNDIVLLMVGWWMNALIEYYWNRVGNMELNKQLTSRMFFVSAI